MRTDQSCTWSLFTFFVSHLVFIRWDYDDCIFFQMSGQRDETKKSMGVSWRQIHRMFIRKTLHFNSDVNKPNYNNKLWNEIQHFLTYNLIGLTRSFLIFYWRLMITPQYLTVLNVFIWHIIIIETIINK